MLILDHLGVHAGQNNTVFQLKPSQLDGGKQCIVAHNNTLFPFLRIFCFLFVPRPGKRRKNGFGKHPFSSAPGGPGRREKVFSRKPFDKILTLLGFTCRKYFCVFIPRRCTKNENCLSHSLACRHFCTKFTGKYCLSCNINAYDRPEAFGRAVSNSTMISGIFEEKFNFLSLFQEEQSEKFGVPEDYLTKYLVYIKKIFRL